MNLQFTKFAAMPEEVIEKYASKVPDELVELWKQYGLGFLLDGYLKIINPEEYIEFVQKTYFRGDLSIPVFIIAASYNPYSISSISLLISFDLPFSKTLWSA